MGSPAQEPANAGRSCLRNSSVTHERHAQHAAAKQLGPRRLSLACCSMLTAITYLRRDEKNEYYSTGPPKSENPPAPLVYVLWRRVLCPHSGSIATHL